MQKKLNVVLVMTMMAFLAACATTKLDMIAEGSVEVLLQRSDDVIFNKVDVHQHNGTTEMEIVIRPRERERRFSVGNINIVVVLPDGREQKVVTDEARIDHHSSGFKLTHAHFMISLPYPLPEASKVKVVYIANPDPSKQVSKPQTVNPD